MTRSSRFKGYQDHPRVCGKDSPFRHLFFAIPGSPPRVRERLERTVTAALQARITPACAGKTFADLGRGELRGDHPRVCGKDYSLSHQTKLYKGSPPRVRERRRQKSGRLHGTRITPACAGKTKTVKDSTHKKEDHPRVCGKDSDPCTKSLRISGSPPRVRERLTVHTLSDHAPRITPACAGKTR
mgnify:CR=1 FL=1